MLPILPHTSLDQYLSLPLGKVDKVQQEERLLTLELVPGVAYEFGEQVKIYTGKGNSIGIEVQNISPDLLAGRYTGGELERIEPDVELRAEFGMQVVSVMLSAVRPYKVWLIVILVSFISFVGYVLVKVFGSSAGIGLTGLVGGLASSTVTTLSFARRSLESPVLDQHFAFAVPMAFAEPESAPEAEGDQPFPILSATCEDICDLFEDASPADDKAVKRAKRRAVGRAVGGAYVAGAVANHRRERRRDYRRYDDYRDRRDDRRDAARAAVAIGAVGAIVKYAIDNSDN